MIDGRVGEILSLLNLEQVMEPVLECPPKWKLLTQIVKEIKDNFTKTYKKPYDRSDDPSRSPHDEVANMILSTHGRVVVVVKDELAISQLRDVLAHGPEYVMDQRFRWFVSQQSAFIRKKYNHSNLSSKSTGSVRVAKYSGSRKSTTSSSSGVDGLDLQNDQSINLTDKVVHQMLSEEGTTNIDRHLDEENMVGSASDDRPGFFGLGLTEGDLRLLNKEMQLMLLQVRLLRFNLYYLTLTFLRYSILLCLSHRRKFCDYLHLHNLFKKCQLTFNPLFLSPLHQKVLICFESSRVFNHLLPMLKKKNQNHYFFKISVGKLKAYLL